MSENPVSQRAMHSEQPSLDSTSSLTSIEHLLEATPTEDIVDERRPFFKGVNALRLGDLEGATKAFRRALREADAPFALLAHLSLGECQRLLGKEGLAIRSYRRVAEAKDAPATLRQLAWMSIARCEEARGNTRAVEKARSRAQQFESLDPDPS